MIKLMSDKQVLQNIDVCTLLAVYFFTSELKMIPYDPHRESNSPTDDEILERIKGNKSL